MNALLSGVLIPQSSELTDWLMCFLLCKRFCYSSAPCISPRPRFVVCHSLGHIGGLLGLLRFPRAPWRSPRISSCSQVATTAEQHRSGSKTLCNTCADICFLSSHSRKIWIQGWQHCYCLCNVFSTLQMILLFKRSPHIALPGVCSVTLSGLCKWSSGAPPASSAILEVSQNIPKGCPERPRLTTLIVLDSVELN